MSASNPPIPLNEQERLQALREYEIMDTSPEETFDSIAKLASYICEVPIALISFIDEDRQWYKAKVGMDVQEISRPLTFCQYAILDDKLTYVPDAEEHSVLKDNPSVREGKVRFYAGTPLTTPSGFHIGTLCVVDSKPKELNEDQKAALETLANHVMAHLELKKRNKKLKNEVSKLAEKALDGIAKELDYYKMAIDETSIVSITDESGVITYVNDKFCAISQFRRDELLGQTHKIIDSGFHSKAFFESLWKTLLAGKVWKNEIKNKAKDGSYYWEDMVVVPFLNPHGKPYKFVSIKRDITEEKHRKQRITNLLKTQSSIIDGASYSIVFMDTRGIIRKINKSGLQLLGFKESEVVNVKTPLIFLDEQELEKVKKELEKEYSKTFAKDLDVLVDCARTKNTADSREWTYITKSGKRIPVWQTITCIYDDEGQVQGYLSVAEDYSSKKKVEAKLIEAKQLAEQAVAMKANFLANMSHEIRTPMNAIIGFTDLISETKLDDTQTEYVGHVKMAGENLLLLVNDILDLSKIEAGKLVIDPQPFNIKASLKHNYELLKIRAHEKLIDFNLFLDAELPDMVVGDKGRLNQIMMNLAGNAIKFTTDGEVNIMVKKVREDEESIELKFSIKDTGIGIPESKLATIFERFSQGEESTSRNFGGTGLGLNISKQLIELQDGKLEVKSRVGIGSEFYFSLIYQKVNDIDVNINNKVELPEINRKVSILLCEDNVINQRLVRNVIEGFGFELDIAHNGKEGIEMFSSKVYDLVLMDLQMPLMDGYQATVHLRTEVNSDIPIIAMTAHSFISERQRCFDLGMNAYVSKPFRKEELYAKILEVLERHGLKEKVEERKVEEAEAAVSVGSKINLSYLRELSENNKEFEKEIIAMFCQKVENEIEVLEKAMHEQDFKEVKEFAHAMKSSASLFLLEKCVYILNQTEKEATELWKNGGTELSKEVFEGINELKQLLGEATEELNDLLEKEY
ncbi:response regulator [Litoribacter ruber]|uniref:response regulator n=1 Tax=Litoribacter ruber TaxID=702568 RepID=UPI001BDAA441|nr:response regulator [Litoribacter ruber]MBT0810330.1 response regulator [Litoribacter ruber]